MPFTFGWILSKKSSLYCIWRVLYQWLFDHELRWEVLKVTMLLRSVGHLPFFAWFRHVLKYFDKFRYFWTFWDVLWRFWTFYDSFGRFMTYLDVFGLFRHIWMYLDIFGCTSSWSDPNCTIWSFCLQIYAQCLLTCLLITVKLSMYDCVKKNKKWFS